MRPRLLDFSRPSIGSYSDVVYNIEELLTDGNFRPCFTKMERLEVRPGVVQEV